MAKYYTTGEDRCCYLIRLHGELYTNLKKKAENEGIPTGTLAAQLFSQAVIRPVNSAGFAMHPDAQCYYLDKTSRIPERNRARQVKITVDKGSMEAFFGLVKKLLEEEDYMQPEGYTDSIDITSQEIKGHPDCPAYRNYRKAFDKKCREVIVSILVEGISQA